MAAVPDIATRSMVRRVVLVGRGFAVEPCDEFIDGSREQLSVAHRVERAVGRKALRISSAIAGGVSLEVLLDRRAYGLLVRRRLGSGDAGKDDRAAIAISVFMGKIVAAATPEREAVGPGNKNLVTNYCDCVKINLF